MRSSARTSLARVRVVLPLIVVLLCGLGTLDASPASASSRPGSDSPTSAPPRPGSGSEHRSGSAGVFSTLAAKWWQWGLMQPASTNPLTDPTGQFCAQGQRGHIWFLAGNFNGAPLSPITRSCTVPRGTDLFFPLVNAFNGYQIGVDGAELNSVKAQRAMVNHALRGVTGLAVSVDGHRTGYSFEESIPFTVVFPPDDNVFGLTADFVLSPTVDAGYYAFVPCLRAGTHTIVFGGTLRGQSAISVTYHLIVS